MSWKYGTNVMGPYGLWWYEKNNIPFRIEVINNRFTDFKDTEHKVYENWFGGRIDCYCSDTEDPYYDPFNRELSLPIMKPKSLKKLDEWLKTYISESFNPDLLMTFEEQTGYTLELFKEGMYG